MGVPALSAAIRDWTIAQIPGGAAGLDQLVCDGKALRGSIEPTASGGSAFIAQFTLYSAALGVAISQACYATGEKHERAVLRQLHGELGVSCPQGSCPAIAAAVEGAKHKLSGNDRSWNRELSANIIISTDRIAPA